jgi:hypothetical protein
MKKNQKRIAVNSQGDEDLEVYILYPENAIADANHKKQNSSFKTALKVKKLHNLKSTN